MIARLRESPHLPRFALAAVGLYLVNQAVIATILGPTRSLFLRIQLTLDRANLEALVAKLTVDDLGRIDQHFGFDTIHPFLYALALTLVGAWVMNRARISSKFEPLLWIPWLAAGCDLVENELYRVFLPAREFEGVWIASLLATVKWGLAAFSVALCTLTLVLPKAWMSALTAERGRSSEMRGVR